LHKEEEDVKEEDGKDGCAKDEEEDVDDEYIYLPVSYAITEPTASCTD